MHYRQHSEISRQELEWVALELLTDGSRHLSHGDKRSDVDRATNVRTSLILRQRRVRELQRAVLVRTGKYSFPRRLRTIWATECVRQFPMDWDSAAYWMNTTIKLLFNRLHAVSDL